MIPQAFNSEAAALGCVIHTPKRIPDILDELTIDSFMDKENRIVFQVISDIYNKNQEIDGVTISDELARKGEFDATNSFAYIDYLYGTVVDDTHLDYYIGLLKKLQRERGMIVCAEKLNLTVNDNSLDINEKQKAIEELVLSIENESESTKVTHIKNDAKMVLQETLDMMDGKFETRGILTGYAKLDSMCRGLSPADLVIIAGRPSMGKSSLAQCMALNIAQDHKVAFFSMEMSTKSVTERMVSTLSGISLDRVQNNFMNGEDKKNYMSAIGDISNRNIWIDGTATLTPQTLTTKLLRMKARYGIECAFVDYIGLMDSGKYLENTTARVAYISKQLKAIAKRTDVPIVVLCQLNRGSESRTDHRPRLSDLRDSGAIEQDADVVMLLYREDYYSNNEPDGEAVCIVAKNRQGPCGDVELAWMPETFEFTQRKEYNASA